MAASRGPVPAAPTVANGTGLSMVAPPVCVDDAGAEPDRGAVSFPDAAHAHHESQAARGRARLVGVGHDARVAQRRTFDRVLAGERRAQQQHSRVGEFAVGIQPVGEFTGVPAEGPHKIAVRPSKRVMTSSNDDRTSSSSRARMRASTAPARDSCRSKPSWPGHEQSGDDARRVGGESLGAARDERGLHRSHCGTAEKRRACCKVESTASVDSAP